MSRAARITLVVAAAYAVIAGVASACISDNIPSGVATAAVCFIASVAFTALHEWGNR